MLNQPLNFQNANPLQTVWWKPIFNLQKEMVHAARDTMDGTPLEDIVKFQENFFNQLEDNFSNIFGEVFNNRQMITPWLLGDHTTPYVDIIENHHSYKLKAELPGVREQDVKVDFVDGGVTISGSKIEECAEKGENYRHQECHVGDFSRTIALPEDADTKNAKSHFNLNVLTVEVPKKPALKSGQPIAVEKKESAQKKAS